MSIASHPMKQVTLLRHGQSNQALGGRDFDRPLNPTAWKDLEKTAQDLKTLPPIDCVLCSGALRTRQTLEFLQNALPENATILFDDSLFLASASYLIQQLEHIDDQYVHVLVIAHWPTLQGAFTLLQKNKTNSFHFAPGDFIHLNLEIDHWQDISWFF